MTRPSQKTLRLLREALEVHPDLGPYLENPKKHDAWFFDNFASEGDGPGDQNQHVDTLGLRRAHK